MAIRERRFSFNQVKQVLGGVLGHDLHAKRRVHSLFRQGCMLYDLIPTMPEIRLRPLMRRFSQMLQDQPLFAGVGRNGYAEMEPARPG